MKVNGEPIDSWDEYNLAIAATIARKSKDERCRVGATIVRDRLILCTGFNGLAREIYDDPNILNDNKAKLSVICHAEQNAIYNAARVGIGIQGATIFVTKFPCVTCCNALIQAGIVRIYTHDDRFWDNDPFDSDHSRKRSLLRQSGIQIDAPYHHEYATKRVVVSETPPTRSAANDEASVEDEHRAARMSRKPTTKPPYSRRRRAKSGSPESGDLPLPSAWLVPHPGKGDSDK